MALKKEDWDALSANDKNKNVGFLKGNCKIDLEQPEKPEQTPNSYPIKDGTTAGGHPMKYGEEYRIYVNDISGIPPFLNAELKECGKKNRIGGSEAIKAIMNYGGLKIGKN